MAWDGKKPDNQSKLKTRPPVLLKTARARWYAQKLRDLLDFVQSEGMEIMDIHTSGHADAQTIQQLIEKVNPRHIIPVHTENAHWFVEYYGEGRVVMDKNFNMEDIHETEH